MAEIPKVLEGSCLCGRVRYTVEGPLSDISNCHCTDCRKSHGAAFSTYADVPRRHLKFQRGEDLLETYRAESGTKRSFCRICGSTLTCFVDSDPEMVEISAATLDTPIQERPRYHIFVRSKVPWLDITDGKPQHEGYPKK